jgi:hypothetical protein
MRFDIDKSWEKPKEVYGYNRYKPPTPMFGCHVSFITLYPDIILNIGASQLKEVAQAVVYYRSYEKEEDDSNPKEEEEKCQLVHVSFDGKIWEPIPPKNSEKYDFEYPNTFK